MAKNRKPLIIGAGGHARSVLENCVPATFLGYVAPQPATDFIPLPYEGSDEYVTGNFNPEEFSIHVGVGFNNGCSLSLRRSIIELYGAFRALTVMAPSAIVTANSKIDDGCAIMARAVVNRSELGRHCVVNTGAIVEHDCKIGTNVFIGPGAVVCGEVTIGDDTFVGAGAIIRNGVTVCSGASIGMGAVVTGDITVPGVYVGVPAAPLKKEENNV